MLDGLDDSVLTRGTHAHLGVMWADLGEYDRCLAAFRAVGILEFPSIEPGRRGWIYAALARTDLARGDRKAAQAWADRSERVLEGLGLPFADAWLLHARAAIALDAGDADAAVRLAFEAIERGEAVKAPLTAARCRTLAGARWPRPGGGRRPSASSRAPRRSCRGSAPPATATRRRASRAGSASVSPPASAGAAARGSTRCRAASARSPSGSPRGAPTARSAPSCSCPRRPSRATSPASSQARRGLTRGGRRGRRPRPRRLVRGLPQGGPTPLGRSFRGSPRSSRGMPLGACGHDDACSPPLPSLAFEPAPDRPRVLDANRLGDHLDRLYRAALGMTGSPADAEDLVQDVCVKVLAKPRLVTGDDDLGYLCACCATRSSPAAAGRPPPRDRHRPRGPRAPRGQRQRRSRARVRGARALRPHRLPDHQRDALVSVDLVGLSYKEAADTLGVPTGTIMSRLFRARKALTD